VTTTSASCRVLGLALVVLGAGACAALPRLRDIPTEPGSPAEAREAYVRACAPCHGADGRGNGTVAPAPAVRPTDLTRLAAAHGGVFPREHVIAVIAGEEPIDAHGTREMPVWRQRFGPPSGATAAASLLARRRLELLASYVESLQRPPALTPPRRSD